MKHEVKPAVQRFRAKAFAEPLSDEQIRERRELLRRQAVQLLRARERKRMNVSRETSVETGGMEVRGSEAVRPRQPNKVSIQGRSDFYDEAAART